jgi:hypothetical protein
VHAPQPVLLSSADALRQRFERSALPPRFYELPVAAGPDRVIEKLDGLPVEHVPRLGEIRVDLQEFLAQLTGAKPRLKFDRERINAESGTSAAKPASKHVEPPIVSAMTAHSSASAIKLRRSTADADTLRSPKWA